MCRAIGRSTRSGCAAASDRRCAAASATPGAGCGTSWPRAGPSVLERKAEGAQQCLALVIGLRARRDADVQPADRIDLVVVDLGEDDLLLHADVVVAAAVERAARYAAEVARSEEHTSELQSP